MSKPFVHPCVRNSRVGTHPTDGCRMGPPLYRKQYYSASIRVGMSNARSWCFSRMCAFHRGTMPNHNCGNSAMCEKMQDVIQQLDGNPLDCNTLKSRISWFRMTYGHNPESSETLRILTDYHQKNCQ